MVRPQIARTHGVVKGNATAGVPVKGIDFLGPLSADVQQTTVFAAGIHAAAKQEEAAKAWVKFLTSPDAAKVIRKTGMEPG
jgi:molybdate transport system substrate-binding protein